MKAKEVLAQHVSPELTKKWPQPVLKAVLAAMKTYHRGKSIQKANQSLPELTPEP